MLFSLVWKNPEDDDDDQPEDEEEPKLASDEEFLHAGETGTQTIFRGQVFVY